MSINYLEFLQKIISAVFVLLFLNKNILAEYPSNVPASEVVNEFKVDEIAKGAYSYRFKTPENIEREENGHLDDEGNLVVDGFYSYTDPDGKQQYVLYHADKDGYRTIKIPAISMGNNISTRKFEPNAIASLLG